MQIDPTTETIVAQQYKAYKKKNIRCHPRIQFLHDLRLFILQQQLLDHEIILGIDANLDQPIDRVFQQFMTSCNLIYIINHRHGTPTATHKSGNRLDLIAGSQFVLDNTIASDSLHKKNSALSDHS